MSEVPSNEIVREEHVVESRPATAAVAPVVTRPVPAYNYRAVQAVWFVTGLIDVLILIRFLLKLLGAAPASPFVAFMYGLTDPLVAPFRGIFPASGGGGYVFEPASVVAIVIYALVGWGIVALIRLLTAPRGTRPVE